MRKNIDFESSRNLGTQIDIDPQIYARVSIVELPFSARVKNASSVAGIKKVSQLLSRAPYEILRIRNMGVGSVKDIAATVSSDYNNRMRKKAERYAKKAIIEAEKRDEFSDVLTSYVREIPVKVNIAETSVKQKKCYDCTMALGIEFIRCVLENREYFGKFFAAANRFAKVCERRESFRRRYKDVIKGNLAAVKVRPFLILFGVDVDPKEDRTVLEYFNEISLNSDADIDFAEHLLTLFGTDIREAAKNTAKAIESVHAGKRMVHVLTQRAAGRTLESIADELGLTRERIRQIEEDCFRHLDDWYKMLPVDTVGYASCYLGTSVLTREKLASVTFPAYADVAFYCTAKVGAHSPFCVYNEDADVIICSIDHKNGDVMGVLARMSWIIDADEFENTIKEAAETNDINEELLSILAHKRYERYGMFMCKSKPSVPFMAGYLLKNYFPDGFKVGDDKSFEEFAEYARKTFGVEPMTVNALKSKIAEVGVLCGRSTYLHPDMLKVPEDVMAAVNIYINTRSYPVVSYTEIFDKLQPLFKGTIITDCYMLYGALKLYGCNGHMHREYVCKVGTARLVMLTEELVKSRGKLSVSDIHKFLGSMSYTAVERLIEGCPHIEQTPDDFFVYKEK
ncbi:MAG: hypothetical protein J6332_04095 [Abditibacteriota bacterium]|nr:hypothetical protein [Abditibacteriota bacterium]